MSHNAQKDEGSGMTHPDQSNTPHGQERGLHPDVRYGRSVTYAVCLNCARHWGTSADEIPTCEHCLDDRVRVVDDLDAAENLSETVLAYVNPED